ncbi:gliding motility-associated C-terminal domain-containing protein, partial [Flagellimonas lutimaris]
VAATAPCTTDATATVTVTEQESMNTNFASLYNRNANSDSELPSVASLPTRDDNEVIGSWGKIKNGDNTHIYIFTPHESNCYNEFRFIITVHDILSQEDCPSLTNPANGATDIDTKTMISWDAVVGAKGYFLTIWGSPNGTEILTLKNVGAETYYRPMKELPVNTRIHVSITPYNEQGKMPECFVQSFTTVKGSKIKSIYGFSPNGDGINEFWTISGIEKYPENIVTIYNRWGNLVFRTEGYNNSSNVFNGIANQYVSMGAGKLPEGTYFFHIQIPKENNLERKKGYLIIKR